DRHLGRLRCTSQSAPEAGNPVFDPANERAAWRRRSWGRNRWGNPSRGRPAPEVADSRNRGHRSHREEGQARHDPTRHKTRVGADGPNAARGLFIWREDRVPDALDDAEIGAT